MQQSKLHITIIGFEKVVFEGDIESLSSFNKLGPFDILPLHSNFITLIENKISLRKIDGTKQEIEIKEAILRNIENNIEIYLGIESGLNE